MGFLSQKFLPGNRCEISLLPWSVVYKILIASSRKHPIHISFGPRPNVSQQSPHSASQKDGMQSWTPDSSSNCWCDDWNVDLIWCLLMFKLKLAQSNSRPIGCRVFDWLNFNLDGIFISEVPAREPVWNFTSAMKCCLQNTYRFFQEASNSYLFWTEAKRLSTKPTLGVAKRRNAKLNTIYYK